MIDEVEEKYINFTLIPNRATLSQYGAVLINQPSFLILLTNSIKLTAPVVTLNLVISLLTAYGFTVWRLKYKEIVFFVYIVVMLMPLQAVLVPNYIVADTFGFLSGDLFFGEPISYLAIILPGIFAPFGTFLLRQIMKGIPIECFEAARIDGAGDIAVFINIVSPQMKSGVAALLMLVFIEYWNLTEQSVIFIKEFYNEPLSVFLSRLASGRAGIIFAASCVYMLPPFLFLLFGQKDLEKGIELSGLKG
jgi:multiple sugar transport system permease protein